MSGMPITRVDCIAKAAAPGAISIANPAVYVFHLKVDLHYIIHQKRLPAIVMFAISNLAGTEIF